MTLDSTAPPRSPSFRHRAEYWLVAGVRWIVGVMPDALSRGFGTCLGLVFFAVDGRHRRVAMDQLQAAFPRRSKADCRAITRATFIHFGRLLIAVLRFSTLTREQMRARVEFQGEDRVHAALAAGKGAIIVTGHFGYWELGGLAHPLVLPPFWVLARPLDNPLLHRLLEDIRVGTGNRVIYKQGALRRVLRALEQNECVAILIDQYSQGAQSVTVEFFNRPAPTTAALASLALRTGAPLVPAVALPLPGGRYRMVYEPAVEMPAADSPDPVRELTQRCTDVLEMYVRRYPHLWLWMHRRWRDDGPVETDAVEMFPAPAPDEGD
jgi:KDO2-lipid IV(A) lauroyltransferase